MTTTKLTVQGMTCMGCVGSVKKVLSALQGVKAVEVKLEGGQVSVQHDPNRASVADLRKAIEDAGYSVEKT